jgi:predicted metalloprotease
VIALLLGADPRQLLEQLPADGQAPATQSSRPTNPEEEEFRQFVGAVLADTEDVWNDIFRQMGRQYREPTLVLFTDQAQSACGVAGAAVRSTARVTRSSTLTSHFIVSSRRGFKQAILLRQ